MKTLENEPKPSLHGLKNMQSRDSKIKLEGNSKLIESSHQITSELVKQCKAMIQYSLSNGLEVEPTIVDNLCRLLNQDNDNISGEDEIKELTSVHQKLSRIVYPATPRTITLLDNERSRQPLFYFLGPVPLIRQLSITSLVFLILLILTSLHASVNTDNIRLGLLNSANSTLFLNQLFLLCSAGLGASFSALFLANTYVSKTTYDPRYNSSYWSGMILGIIAGIILVELLPPSFFEEGAMKNFGKPTIAMLGGFSSKVVYRLLQRLVDALETLVKGKNNSDTEYQKQILQAQTSEQKKQANAETASRIVSILGHLDNLDNQAIKQQLGDLAEELLPKE
ncbi:hypothetical protein [Aliikangiella sp. IMCC44359]|uniref:hypothetical protein n=1 Tax=Aliikangiella sp. IMCC44359 TaxID=3459125 RepID=UPI00403B1D4D